MFNNLFSKKPKHFFQQEIEYRGYKVIIYADQEEFRVVRDSYVSFKTGWIINGLGGVYNTGILENRIKENLTFHLSEAKDKIDKILSIPDILLKIRQQLTSSAELK